MIATVCLPARSSTSVRKNLSGSDVDPFIPPVYPIAPVAGLGTYIAGCPLGTAAGHPATMVGNELPAAPVCHAVVLADCAYAEQWVSRWTPIACATPRRLQANL